MSTPFTPAPGWLFQLIMLMGSRYSAYGEFEVTDDCSDITSASFLNKVGKKTPVLLRVSIVAGESGAAAASEEICLANSRRH